MRRSPFVAVGLALSIALAGCSEGDGDSADGAGASTTVGDVGAGCALLPVDELAELLDRDLDEPRDTSSDGDLGCAYRSKPSQDAADVVFASLAVKPTGGSTFDAAADATRRKAQRVTDLGGVGERALLFVTTQGQSSAYQVMTRDGDVLATLVVAGRVEETVAKDAAVTALERVLERIDR